MSIADRKGLLLWAAVLFLIMLFFRIFFIMGMPLPNSELLCETESPNGAYTVRVYRSNPQTVFSDPAVWCEYSANYVQGWSRMFFLDTASSCVEVVWSANDTVIVGDRTMRLPYDTYDSRREPGDDGGKYTLHYIIILALFVTLLLYGIKSKK